MQLKSAILASSGASFEKKTPKSFFRKTWQPDGTGRLKCYLDAKIMENRLIFGVLDAFLQN